MVVRTDAGDDVVHAYVVEQAARGRDHVVQLVSADYERLLSLIGDLSEEQATTVTEVDEWRVFDLMRHLTGGLGRSRERIGTLASGEPYVSATPSRPGSLGDDYASYAELREAYTSGMATILDVLRAADETHGLDVTAEHGRFGPFNWLEWAVYMHHVHTHDHMAQLERIVEALPAR